MGKLNLVVLMLAVLIGSAFATWTMSNDNSSVSWTQNSYSISTTPAVATGPDYVQYVNFSSNNSNPIITNFSFVFKERPATGDILLWQNASHNVTVPVTSRTSALYNVNGVTNFVSTNESCYIGDNLNTYHLAVSYNAGNNTSTSTLCFDSYSNISNNYTLNYSYVQTTYTTQIQWYNDWGSILGSFAYSNYTAPPPRATYSTTLNGVTGYVASTSACQIGDNQNSLKYNVSFGSGNSTIACFNSFVQNGSSYTLTYQLNSGEAQTYHIYTINNVQFNKGTNFATKFMYTFPSKPTESNGQVSMGSNGKFDIYAHTGTPQQVIAGTAQVYVVLDPWYIPAVWNKQSCVNVTNVACLGAWCSVQVPVAFGAGATNGSDIRAILMNGTAYSSELNFWREDGFNTTNSSGNVWLNVTNGTTPRVCFLYNVTGTVADKSSVDGTFPFGDDFNGAILNTSKWATTTAGGYIGLSGTGNLILENNTGGTIAVQQIINLSTDKFKGIIKITSATGSPLNLHFNRYSSGSSDDREYNGMYYFDGAGVNRQLVTYGVNGTGALAGAVSDRTALNLPEIWTFYSYGSPSMLYNVSWSLNNGTFIANNSYLPTFKSTSYNAIFLAQLNNGARINVNYIIETSLNISTPAFAWDAQQNLTLPSGIQNYQYYFPINCSNVDTGTPIVINGSSGFTLGGQNQIVWTTCQPDLYLYYNNYTSYAVANNTSQVAMEVEHGNATSFNPTSIWATDTSTWTILHMGEITNTTNAIDSSNTNNLTTTGAVNPQIGKIDGARGNNFGNNFFSKNTNPFTSSVDQTMCGWFNFSSTTGNQALIAKGLNIGSFYSDLYILTTSCGDNKIGMTTWKAGNALISACSVPITTNTWYYICGTYNATSTNGDIYVNAINGTTSTYNQGAAGTAGSVSIGVAEATANTHVMQGIADEIRIYTSRKSVNWINQTYQNGISTAGYGTLGVSANNSQFQNYSQPNLLQYQYRTAFQVYKPTNTTQAYFPAPIQFNSSALISANKSRSDCLDNIFTDVNNNLLNFDFDSGCNAAYNATVWVSIPSFANNTTVYMYYGNPSETLNRANASGVWLSASGINSYHLGGTGNEADSAGNNAMTMTGTVSSTTGKFGLARGNDWSSSNYLSYSNAVFPSSDSKTIIMWVRPLASTPASAGFFTTRVSTGSAFQIQATYGAVECGLANNFSSCVSKVGAAYSTSTVSTAKSSGSYTMLATRYNSNTTQDTFSNGTIGKSAVYSSGAAVSGEGFKLGVWYSPNADASNWSIDEVHIYNSSKSDSWIADEYGSYCVEGAEETIPSGATVPVMNNVTILPAGIVYQTETILGYCNATDSGGLNITYNYTWYLNSTAFSSGSLANQTSSANVNVANITYPNLAANQNWTLQCTPTSTSGTGVAMNSSVKTITRLILHPSSSSIFTTGSASTTSATFVTIQSFNYTPQVANDSDFHARVTITTNANVANVVGEWQVLANGVVIGKENRSVTTPQAGSLYLVTQPFVGNNTSVINITVQHRRVSGAGTLVSSDMETVIEGDRDIDNNIKLDNIAFNLSGTTSSNGWVNVQNYTFPAAYDGVADLEWSSQIVKTSVTSDISYQFKITNGTYTTNCGFITRTVGGGSFASTGGRCEASVTKGNQTVQLWINQNTPAGTATFSGYGFVNGILPAIATHPDDWDYANLSTFSTASATAVHVQNLTISFGEDIFNHSIDALFSAVVNNPSASANAYFTLGLYNSTGGLVNSSNEEVRWVTQNQFGVKTMQHVWQNVSPGTYTIAIYARTSAATLQISNGTFGVHIGDLVVTQTSYLPPTSPIIYVPNASQYLAGTIINTTYESSSPSNLSITYNVSIINSTNNATYLYLANGTSSLNTLWNTTGISGFYYLRVTAIQSDGQTATTNGTVFQLSAVPASSLAAILSANNDTTFYYNYTLYGKFAYTSGMPATPFDVYYKLYRDGVLIQNQSYTNYTSGTIISAFNYSNAALVTHGSIWSMETGANDTFGNATPINTTVTILNSIPTNLTISATDTATGHWFLVNSSATDSDGASDINSTSIFIGTGNNTSVGTCSYVSNSTSGNTLNVQYNCTNTYPATVNVTVSFTDYATIVSTTLQHAVPDHSPALTAPTLNSPLYYNGTVTCTPGTFSDIDTDTENVSGRVFAWYKNGSVLVGKTATTYNVLDLGVKGDAISCSEFAIANVWVSSNTTVFSTNVTISNSIPTNPSVVNFTDATAGHWFTVNGTVTDGDLGTDIATTNVSSTSGVCTYKSNTTSGYSFIVTYNCTNTNPTSTTVTIGFTDKSGAYTSATSASHSYIDHQLTLSPPSVSSPIYANGTITCTGGSYSDPDSDPENVSARAFTWFKNGVLVSGVSATTINASDISAAKGNQVSCTEFVIAQNWTGSNATVSSTNVTVSNSVPSGQVANNFTDASAGHWFTIVGTVYDGDGGSDIIATDIASTYSSCVYLSNSTFGQKFNVTYNCTATAEGTTTLTIGFNDSSAQRVTATSEAHAYPDHVPVLTGLTITPIPIHANDTITCNAGVFTDPDGDVENVSDRLWLWYSNGVPQGFAPHVQTALASSVGGNKGVNQACLETTSAQYWPTISTTDGMSSNYTVVNSIPVNPTVDTFTDEPVAGHSFTVIGTVTDGDFGSDIKATDVSATHGTCVYVSNTSNTYNFYVTYNCTATTPGNTTVTIGFTDGSGIRVQNTSVSHAYIDHQPTLVPPTLSSPLYYNSVAICSAGVFSDPDGDLENVPIRVNTFYENGVYKTSGLGLANSVNLTTFPAHHLDSITCRENSTALVWPTSVVNQLSAPVVLDNTVPTIPTSLTYTNTLGTQFTFNASGSVDFDNETITYYYQFENDTAILQAFSTTASYNCGAGECPMGANLTIRAKAYDSYGFSDIKNVSFFDWLPVPQVFSVSLTPQLFNQSQVLTAVPSVAEIYFVYYYQYVDDLGTILQAYSPVNTYTVSSTFANKQIFVYVYANNSTALSPIYSNVSTYYPTYLDPCNTPAESYGAPGAGPFFERFIVCKINLIVGNQPQIGGLMLAVMFVLVFFAFIALKGFGFEAFVVVMVPVLALATIWIPWLIYPLAIFAGLVLLFVISKIVNR